MENEEIILENDIDTVEQITDIIELDNTDSETQEFMQSGEESSMESILLRIEEMLSNDSEHMQDEEEVFSSSSGVESAPLLVQDTNNIDYTDILIQINNNLYDIKDNQETMLEYEKPHDIFTPLESFSLSEVLLSVALIGFGLFAGIKVIKNHIFHLR